MGRDGEPAPNPPPARHAQVRVTLVSCREILRAAVRRLAQAQPRAPGASGQPGQTDAGPPDGGPDAGARSAAVLREFEAAERAYDDLITNISHDVKTSLTVIRGHAQMAARAIRRGDAIDRDALLATLQVIDTSAMRISNDLDDWAGGHGDPG